MQCAAAIHFMRKKGWEMVMDACLQHPSVRQHQVGKKSWELVCKAWRENFASMCVFAWRSAWVFGANCCVPCHCLMRHGCKLVQQAVPHLKLVAHGACHSGQCLTG